MIDNNGMALYQVWEDVSDQPVPTEHANCRNGHVLKSSFDNVGAAMKEIQRIHMIGHGVEKKLFITKLVTVQTSYVDISDAVNATIAQGA